MKIRILLAGVATALALSAGAAQASIVFNFNGICTTCSLGGAFGSLTLTDGYVFGTDITSATFQQFSYSSSSGSFAIDIPTTLQGGLNADGSLSGASLDIAAGSFADFSDNGVTAHVSSNALPINDSLIFPKFTLVGAAAAPEPATWATMILGLGAMGAMFRRRRGQGQALA